jgi:hypothetical protein
MLPRHNHMGRHLAYRQIKISQPINVGLLSEVARAMLTSMMKGLTPCHCQCCSHQHFLLVEPSPSAMVRIMFPLYSPEQWIELDRSTPKRPPSRKALRSRKSTPRYLSKLGLCWRGRGIGWAPHTLNAYHSQCLAILSFTTQQLLRASTTRRTDLHRI